jgi:hypothetical protein
MPKKKTSKRKNKDEKETKKYCIVDPSHDRSEVFPSHIHAPSADLGLHLCTGEVLLKEVADLFYVRLPFVKHLFKCCNSFLTYFVAALHSQTSKCCKWLTYFIGGRLPLQIIQVLVYCNQQPSSPNFWNLPPSPNFLPSFAKLLDTFTR